MLRHPRLKISHLNVFVGLDCSLRCKYCFIDEKNRRSAEKGTLTDILRWFLDDGISTESVTIHIFGTEPLFDWTNTKHVIEEAERLATHKKHCKIGITTNGVGLTPEISKYLAEKDIYVLCSMDGTKENHDSARVFPDGSGSWDIVTANFRNWLREGHYTEAAITVTPTVMRNLLDNVIAMFEVGFDCIALNRCTDSVEWYYTEEDFKIFDKQLDYLINYLVSLAKQEIYYAVAFFTNAVYQRAKGRYVKNEATTCGAGKGGLAADIDGNLYICHRAIYYDQFKVGDIYNGLDWDNLSKYRTLTHKVCTMCDMENCSPCYVSNYVRYGDIFHNQWEYCRFSQLMREKAIRMEELLKIEGVYDKYIAGLSQKGKYNLDSPIEIRKDTPLKDLLIEE